MAEGVCVAMALKNVDLANGGSWWVFVCVSSSKRSGIPLQFPSGING